MTHVTITLTGIIAALGALSKVVWHGIKGAYKMARRVETTFEYVDELRSNHIPHLEYAVKAIGTKVGLSEEEMTLPDHQPPQQ